MIGLINFLLCVADFSTVVSNRTSVLVLFAPPRRPTFGADEERAQPGVRVQGVIVPLRLIHIFQNPC